jgi:hypothetical protein
MSIVPMHHQVPEQTIKMILMKESKFLGIISILVSIILFKKLDPRHLCRKI